MKVKRFNEIYENNSETLKVYVNDKVNSEWVYLHDAIENGILENYLDISNDDLEELSYLFDDEIIFVYELTDIILSDFNELTKLLRHFNIDRTIKIEGYDENGEYVSMET